MDMGLEGKVVMVTGGTKGNGKAVGLGFAAEGALVSFCDYQEDLLNAVTGEIERLTGGTVFATKADVTKQKELADFVGKTLNRFGRIDILVNNAIGPAAPGAAREFPEISDEELKTAMERKFLPYARCARAVVPHMIARGSGRIINIAGNSGILDYGPAHMVMAYNNTAVMRLTTDLAANLAKHGILVNAISPGPVETERWKGLIHDWALERKLSEEEIWKENVARIPIRRMAKPEDIANLAIFLASERASCITGTVINIDGGMSLRF
jgi:NAD(P)-dependent dehydrogenase (short-subunit alcohol dehydrogenase family)